MPWLQEQSRHEISQQSWCVVVVAAAVVVVVVMHCRHPRPRGSTGEVARARPWSMLWLLQVESNITAHAACFGMGEEERHGSGVSLQCGEMCLGRGRNRHAGNDVGRHHGR